MKHWYVYMAVTSQGKFYTGISTDPQRRVYEHNYTNKGAKCLRGQRPIKLVWKRQAQTKSAALKEEYYIKHLSRIQKIGILAGHLECLISHEELEAILFKQGAF